MAGGLWETRSVFQGVWEGGRVGERGWQPSIPRQTGGRGEMGVPGEEGGDFHRDVQRLATPGKQYIWMDRYA